MHKLKYFIVFVFTSAIIALGLMGPDITSYYHNQQLLNKVERCDLDTIKLDSKQKLTMMQRLNLLNVYTSLVTLNPQDYDLENAQKNVINELSILFQRLELPINMEGFTIQNCNIECHINQGEETSLLYWNFSLFAETYGTTIDCIMDAETNKILALIVNGQAGTELNYYKYISSIFEHYMDYLEITNYLSPFSKEYESFFDDYNRYKKSNAYGYQSSMNEDADYAESLILGEEYVDAQMEGEEALYDYDTTDMQTTSATSILYIMSISWDSDFFALN